MPIVDLKAQNLFAQKISHKGLLLKLQSKFNLPVYIIDGLIAKYSKGMETKSEIEALIREKTVNSRDRFKKQREIQNLGKTEIIDKLNIRQTRGEYLASIINLGLKDIQVSQELIEQYPELLERGMWGEIKLIYQADNFKITKFSAEKNDDFSLEEYQNKAKKFSFIQWITLLLRTLGFASEGWPLRKKLLLLSRLIPLVEKNYNYIELGARGTGKSYVYRNLFSQAILVSGGKTTVANLFYNMGRKEIGLVGKWDVVAFDEVAYIDFKDKTAVQILKDYMESASFSRGDAEIFAEASMVFLGNINQGLEELLQKSHLFEPLPELLKDLALLDRFHFYLSGWEMDKLSEEDFTGHYGLQSQYFASALHKLRELDFTEVIDDYFEFTKEMDVRDKKSVRKTVSGFLKLLHPAGDFNREHLKSYLDLALEGRKRVKEQLIKLGAFEYKENTFSYFEVDSEQQYFPNLPESHLDNSGQRKILEPGVVYIGQIIDEEKFALLKLTIESKTGEGKLIFQNVLDQTLKRYIRKTFLYLRDQKTVYKIDREELRNNNFYLTAERVKHEVRADIGNAFIIALYSLLNNKSVSHGLLVDKRSSIYRKTDSKYGLKALKVESDGRIRALLPLKNNKMFIEVPNEIINYAPYFIKV